MRKKKKGLLSSGFMFGVDQYLQNYVKEHGRLPWHQSPDREAGRITLGVEVKRCDECDRVEVVRCKDCKSYSGEGKCRKCNLWRDPEDFCSRGEKKEDET